MHGILSNSYYEVVGSSLADTIKKHRHGATILFELPAESYFFANTASLKYLTNNNYKGVYISFQRPFKNIYDLFEKHEINNDRILILDCSNCEKPKINEENNNVNISSFNVDDFGNKIVKALKSLKCKNKFIYVDSLTTVALYKNTSEIKRLTEILMDIINNNDFGNVLIVLNVAEDLSKKKFVKDISNYADEIVNILECDKKYSRDILESSVCT